VRDFQTKTPAPGIKPAQVKIEVRSTRWRKSVAGIASWARSRMKKRSKAPPWRGTSLIEVTSGGRRHRHGKQRTWPRTEKDMQRQNETLRGDRQWKKNLGDKLPVWENQKNEHGFLDRGNESAADLMEV
jgi:hypothetical protein